MNKLVDAFNEPASFIWYPVYKPARIILGKVYPSEYTVGLDPFVLGLDALVRENGCIDRVLIVYEEGKKGITVIAFITAVNIGHIQTLAWRLSNRLVEIYGGQASIHSSKDPRQIRRLLNRT